MKGNTNTTDLRVAEIEGDVNALGTATEGTKGTLPTGLSEHSTGSRIVKRNGVVTIYFDIKISSAYTSGTSFLYIPVGYRPIVTTVNTIPDGTENGRINIAVQTNGTVIIYYKSGQQYVQGSVTYIAEN